MLLPLALLLAAEPAPIVVTATPLIDAQIAEQAGAYVRDVLPTPQYGQYARWAVPICVKVAGVEDAIAARVARRIEAAATDATAKVAKPGCKPNLEIVFTPDAATTIKTIVRRQPKQIARLNGPERETLLTAALPVRWWHGLELRDRDGSPAVPGGSAALMSAGVAGGPPLGSVLPVGPDTAMTDSRSSSLIASSVAVWVTSAVVVIDVTLATGKPLDAVSDYVALAALAPLKLPPPAPAVPSILGLFATPDSPIDRLSRWDRAWLSAVYSIPMARSGQRQRGDITARITATMKE
jgi:hypothetical protein